MYGMRSTFRNWGRERADFRPELLELAVAHAVGNAVERAYARDDALEHRCHAKLELLRASGLIGLETLQALNDAGQA